MSGVHYSSSFSLWGIQGCLSRYPDQGSERYYYAQPVPSDYGDCTGDATCDYDPKFYYYMCCVTALYYNSHPNRCADGMIQYGKLCRPRHWGDSAAMTVCGPLGVGATTALELQTACLGDRLCTPNRQSATQARQFVTAKVLATRRFCLSR